MDIRMNKKIDRPIERQIIRKIDTEIDRWMHLQIDSKIYTLNKKRHMEEQTDTYIWIEIDEQKNEQTDRQIDRQTDRQTDRKTVE